ncbi:nucleolar protein 14 isoform X2 [Panicum miliaceum]|uniref:Nucleolar protein 14 isoform X2 n=1 Tax=Panicum miliaceum TaxID=4540 RepID=A0A3L6TKS1_PANMI|nr:nucleolar protein 14 isoform X2 [Panicum miliaceum]
MAKTKPMAAAAAAGEKKKSKGKKKVKNGPAKVAMKARAVAAEERSNPFEAIWSRRKFDVLGKKRKGEERRVSRARSEAIRKRENTLLKEFEESAKSSVFHDRRIGETDDTLPEFDKAVLRQQRERLAKLKRESKYNLPDEDDDEINVHNLLSEKDDFDEEVPFDDESDEEGNMVLSKKRLSLQGGDRPSETDLPQETHGHKSKKEVMMEIISKSKFYKAQKAKEREEDEHLVDKLDSDFASLAQTQALLSLTEPTKVKANKSDSIAGLTGKEIFTKAKSDTYEKMVKEMVMDQRARPSDRTKTPEEIAQEEKERLEKLEGERQKRMLGTADSSDEDDDNEDDNHMKLDNSKPISGDDLGDSFTDDSIGKKKGWVDEIYEKEGRKIGDDAVASDDEESDDEHADDDESDDDEEDDDAEDDSNDFGNMSARDWEQSDDDEVDAGDDEMDDVHEKEQGISGKVVKRDAQNLKKESNVKTQVKDGGVPFVIDAPNNLKDLSSLLDGRSETEIIEIISRIRTCNSIRLAAENRRKMQIFYGVLLQYFAVLATQSPVKFKIIDTLVKPLIEMSGETPYFAAICARERLIHTRTRLCEEIKVPGKSSWPNLKTLLLLRLWSLTFPCSDFRHVVATPMLLLMCEYLMRCPIQSGRDVAVGSFLCSMVLVATKESKKFCPEAIAFLQSLLVTSLKGKVGTHLHNQINDQFMELKTLKPWLSIHEQVHEVNPVNVLEIMGMDPDAPYFVSDDFKAGVLLSVAECLRGFVIIHEELSSFPEIFLPISSLLQEILDKSEVPSLLRDILLEVIDLIKKRSDEHHASREPLRMRKKKPEPIKQLNPKFEENYIKGLDYDPDRERAQMKKLKKRLKSEKSGAMRELRKDNYFLSAVKEKERIKQEQERAEKYGKAMAFLQEQESAFKSGQLGKGKGRKRRR